jgi:tryptophan synthase beta chain
MKAYQDYFEGKIVKHGVTSDEIKASLAELETPEID